MARTFVSASSQYLQSTAAPLTGTPATIACWFYRTDASGTESLVGVYNSGASAVNGLFLDTQSSGVLRVRSGNGTASASASTTATFAQNSWNHGCGVFTSDTSRTPYLNGVAGTANTTSNIPSGVNVAGAGRLLLTTPSQYWGGRIAEFGVWNVALAAGEVAALAAGVSPLRVRPGALVGYWPLLGLDSPETDWSPAGGTRRPLTVTGATAGNHAPVEPFSRRSWVSMPTWPAAGPPPPPAADNPAAILGHL